MPATPAWPPKSTPRLFTSEALDIGRVLQIEGSSAHYLIGVMRLKEGGAVKLFDDRSGEYLAAATQIGKRSLTVIIERKLREREIVPDLWLCQALIKKDRFDWIAEKSCELGISCFQPVITRRCVADKLKDDRLRTRMIEAAEHCERAALPQIAPLKKLEHMLSDWPDERSLFFCDERGGENFAKAIAAKTGPAAILIGPEGGFTDEENALIRSHPRAVAVSLGPRILRAETAAITAIAAWMANSTASDWR